MEYVATELNPTGGVEFEGSVKKVEVRANAVEVRRTDALALQERAQKMWPDSHWEIQKTFSGRYVIYAYN